MATKRTDFTATEIKAGTLVLVSLVVLVGFLAAIRGCGPRGEDAKTFYATFTNISGLNRGADVRFGGVKVGRVAAIDPDPEDRSKIRVTAEVGGDAPVNEGSVASIEQVTLTTEKHLEISTGGGEQPLLEDGSKLATREAGGFMDMPDLEGVTVKLELLLDNLNALLGVEQRLAGNGGEEELVDLAEIMASLDSTLDESTGALAELRSVISDNREGLREVVGKLVALENVSIEMMEQVNGLVTENRQPLGEAARNLARLTDEAGARVEELAATLRYFEEVGGNASDLLEVQRPTLEEILLNLQETTRNLAELSRTLADRPQALIRGKGNQGRPNEEKE